jgi:hypothetical protein
MTLGLLAPSFVQYTIESVCAYTSDVRVDAVTAPLPL